MNRISPVVLIVVAILLVSCGEPHSDGGSAEPAASETTDGAFDPMLETLSDAERLEEEVLRRKAEADARLEQMESGEDPRG